MPVIPRYTLIDIANLISVIKLTIQIDLHNKVGSNAVLLYPYKKQKLGNRDRHRGECHVKIGVKCFKPRNNKS